MNLILRGCVLAVLLGARCGARTPPPPPPPEPPPPAPPTPASGTIDAGTYRDATFPLTAAVPAEWTAAPGRAGSALRVSLTHAPTAAHIEVRALVGEPAAPAPRSDCDWRFVDTANYRSGPEIPGPRTVASCVPREGASPRGQGWYVARDGVAWQVEAWVPPGVASEALPAVDAALRGIVVR